MEDTNTQSEKNFRDKISTVDIKGKRKWMYVFKPKGTLYNLRTYFSIVYLLLLFGLPFVKHNGNPIFLFNVTKSTFIFFGQVFLPQDFILFGIGMLVFLLFVVVFTLIFGRVFCGWACPQTIFLEMDLRKAIKHIIFFGLSFIIANTFLSYIIGVDELFHYMKEPMSKHVLGIMMLIVFTVLFYAVYAFVREISCIVICPYGRLQGVLLDRNSIVVIYDYLRGEPRTKKRKDPSEKHGDCIDCGMCVNVCPTGIDIRNGTQLECVNCTSCIDACNMMMKNVGLEPNLIKFGSENDVTTGVKPTLTYRIKMYGIVLIILLSVLIGLLTTRDMFDATVLRVAGQILQENPDNSISNLYKIKIVSKSGYTEPYHLELDTKDAHIEYVGRKLDSLKSGIESEEIFFIKVAKEHITQRKENMHILVKSGNEIIQTKKITFIGLY